jgi:hypothetical protein
LGTFTTEAANFTNTDSYTLVTHTASFDINSALESDYACTTSESVVHADWGDFTFSICDYFTSMPVAASTALAYRTAAATFPSGGVIPTSDAYLYDLYTADQSSATTAVSIAPNQTFVETSATPFVHFTAYEVESGNSTLTVQLASAYIYEYSLKGIENDTTAVGPLPDDFLEHIPQSNCDAGQLQAEVTVVIVVDLYYQNLPMLNSFIVHFESTAIGFDDPPVNVNNDGSSSAPPLTMDDWDISSVNAKPTTQVSINPSVRPDPVSTTLAGNNNPNNNQRPSSYQVPVPDGPEPTQVTVGVIGTVPVVIGPSSVVVVGSQTLQPGGPAITVDGVTPVSLAPSATAIVIDGTTSQLPEVVNPPVQQPVRPPPVLTIGTLTVTPNAATQFFIAPGQTLTPGGVATLDGTVVSLAPFASFVVIGSSTQFLPAPAPGIGSIVTILPQIVVGGTTVVALPSDGAVGSPSITPNNNPSNVQNAPAVDAGPGPTFVVGGQTLAPGGQAITVSGTTLSLVSGGSSVVINGVTSAVANPVGVPVENAQPAITVGDTVFTPVPGGSGDTFNIAGQTLAPGGQAITVSGTVISLAPSASYVVINGVTSTIARGFAASPQPTIRIGGNIFTPIAGPGSGFVIGDKTLLPGGHALLVSGTVVSLAPYASFVVINGVTSTLANIAAAAQITAAPTLTIGTSVFRPLPGTGTSYLFGSQILTPGGVVTSAGSTISLALGATALIINGQTSLITSSAQAIITNAPVLTIGSQTYTAVSGTTFVIGGQTLTPGGTITVDGTTISLAPQATQLIYGSSGRTTTTALFPATRTQSQSVTATTSASAGASGSNSQAAATSPRQSAASKPSMGNSWMLAFVAAFVGFRFWYAS